MQFNANLGHPSFTVGALTLIKAVLQLQHQAVPPNLNLEEPIDLITESQGRLQCPVTLQTLSAQPLIGSIHGHGVGGAPNVHMIVAHPSFLETRTTAPVSLLPFSGCEAVEAEIRKLPYVEQAVIVQTDSELVGYVQTNQYENDKINFRLERRGLRVCSPDAFTVPLPPVALEISNYARKSYRRFEGDTPNDNDLRRCLELASACRVPATSEFESVGLGSDFTPIWRVLRSVLAPWESDTNLLPKYKYPSAGSTYAVQVYISIPSLSACRVPPGIYYYHPVDHALVQVSTIVAHLDDVVLQLVGKLDAIKPLYNEQSMRMLQLEAGYILDQLEGEFHSVHMSLTQQDGAFRNSQDLLTDAGVLQTREELLLCCHVNSTNASGDHYDLSEAKVCADL